MSNKGDATSIRHVVEEYAAREVLFHDPKEPTSLTCCRKPFEVYNKKKGESREIGGEDHIGGPESNPPKFSSLFLATVEAQT